MIALGILVLVVLHLILAIGSPFLQPVVAQIHGSQEGVSAAIIEFYPASGTYMWGDAVTSSLRFKNTGTVQSTFWVDLTIINPSGNAYGHSETPVTLNPGETSGLVSLTWTVPSVPCGVPSVPCAVAGSYTVVMGVWTAAFPLGQKLDGRVQYNAFQVSIAPTTTTAVSFDFSISVSPDSGSVIAGSALARAAVVTVTLLSGSPQSVSFSLSGLLSNVGTDDVAGKSCTPSPSCQVSFGIGTYSTAPPGTYPLTITGTAGGQIHSTTYTLTVSGPTTTSAALTDVVAEQCWVSPSNPKAGDAVTFYVQFNIVGGTGPYVFRIEAYLDGQFVSSPPLPGPLLFHNAGTHTVSTDTPWTAVAGSHTLRWVLNGDHAMTESNYSNNEVTCSFTVGTQPGVVVNLFSATTDGLTDKGSITFDGIDYNLPAQVTVTPNQQYGVTANPPSGYGFDHWEKGNGVTGIGDQNAQSTWVFVQSAGYLKAWFSPIVVGQPHLMITVTADRTIIGIGETTGVTILIANDGQSSAVNVDVSVDTGVYLEAVSGRLSWHYDQFAAGASDSVQIVVRGKAEGSGTVNVQASYYDAQGKNYRASGFLTIEVKSGPTCTETSAVRMDITRDQSFSIIKGPILNIQLSGACFYEPNLLRVTLDTNNIRDALYVVDVYVGPNFNTGYSKTFFIQERGMHTLIQGIPRQQGLFTVMLDVNVAFGVYEISYAFRSILGFGPSTGALFKVAEEVKQEYFPDVPALKISGEQWVDSFANYMLGHPDEFVKLAAESGNNYDGRYFAQKAQIVKQLVSTIINFVLQIIKNLTDPAEERIFVVLTDSVQTITIGAIVGLNEKGQKLYVSVLDSSNRHVGFNSQSNSVDIEIPGAGYFESATGIMIMLPKGVESFRVSVDATNARETTETYNLTVSTISNGQEIKRWNTAASIQKGNVVSYDVAISTDGELTITTGSWNYREAIALLVAAAALAIGIAVFARRRSRRPRVSAVLERPRIISAVRS